MTKTRVEAFSDGVFAIVMTLLAIEIRPPDLASGESLAHGLWSQWPSYVAYVLSFLVLGVMWLNHHRIFEPVRRLDGLVLVLNLNLLLWAVLIPFPTATVAEFLREGGADAETAVALTAPPCLKMSNAVSIARLSSAGAKAAAVNRAMLFRMPEKSETRLIRSRYGKVIWVRRVARSSFSAW